MPSYLRFVKGVVDSEDLSLNISREILQQNRQIRVMRKRLVKKVLETLEEMRDSRADDYKKFWGEFGRLMKEGIFEDAENRDRLLGLCRFDSTQSPDEQTTLDGYISRMKPGQEKIYYLTGESRVVVENSPHLEAAKEKGIEVLILSDPVDEVWTQSAFEYDGKPFESIGKGAADLGGDDDEEAKASKKEALEKRRDEVKDLLAAMQKHLDAEIKEVRLTQRLTKSPACLVGETTDMTPQLEQMLKAMNQEVPVTKRILELNPEHDVLKKLEAVFKADPNDSRIGEYSELLLGQALLAEGTPPKDPAKLGRLIADLMVKSL
jgi:molecular chaperone HtpG